MDITTTIAAICTPQGSGAIATIRISGPEAFHITDRIWKGRRLSQTQSHTAHLGTITDIHGDSLDQALATTFRAPNSFTGQDTVEISCHGSQYIQQAILTALIDAGAKIAAPGEFTQRAFINRRIDLAQAEAIADLIAAKSQAAHRIALAQTKGQYSRHLEQQRQDLISLAAMLELELDFSEEDVTFADRTQLRETAGRILAQTDRLAQTYASGQAIREGHPIAIAGAPNAGKSTLINTLLGDDIAIVSDIPGTTRDAIQATTTIGPHLIRFIDTAGIRHTTDTIEALGIDRAHRHIRDARTIIWLIDPTASIQPQLDDMDRIRKTLDPRQTLIPVAGKNDLADSTVTDALSSMIALDPAILRNTAVSGTDTPASDRQTPIITIDSRTPRGIEPLLQTLRHHLDTTQNADADITVTNGRHYQALRDTADALRRTLDAIDAGHSADLIATELRQATAHLGTITGAITTDTLLTHIFSRFCIGK